MPVPLTDAAITAIQVARPAPIWRGVATIVLHCNYNKKRLCAQLAEQARRAAPIRITTIAETPTIATLRVIATFGDSGSTQSLTLAADRPVPMDDAQGGILPRRFVAAAGESTAQFFDRALDAFLPWRGKGGPGRMIRLPKGETLK